MQLSENFDHDRFDAVYRTEAGRCVATLVRVLGDVDLAEDAVADAFAIAAQRWPIAGIPPNPGGWITTTARNRAIDHLRRESSRDRRQRAAHDLAGVHANPEPTMTECDDLDDRHDIDVVPDDQLRLIFLCCHPALSPDAQVALTLRLLGGLQTEEIARAFVVPEATLAQRLVRAKRKIRDNNIAYRIPAAAELTDRLGPVLATLYLIYNEGHSASGGTPLTRDDLTAEAIRLTRLLVELMPDEPEATGLLAFLLLTEARRPARTDASGVPVRLSDQDRSRWNRRQIAEGHSLVRACLRRNQPGVYQLQAAIAAVHADAVSFDATDWTQVVTLYNHLYQIRPTPIIALNRAIAIAELADADAALEAVESIEGLDAYHLYHATRADLLARTGRVEEALAAYQVAIDLAGNQTERDHFAGRRDEIRRG